MLRGARRSETKTQRFNGRGRAERSDSERCDAMRWRIERGSENQREERESSVSERVRVGCDAVVRCGVAVAKAEIARTAQLPDDRTAAAQSPVARCCRRICCCVVVRCVAVWCSRVLCVAEWTRGWVRVRAIDRSQSPARRSHASTQQRCLSQRDQLSHTQLCCTPLIRRCWLTQRGVCWRPPACCAVDSRSDSRAA